MANKNLPISKNAEPKNFKPKANTGDKIIIKTNKLAEIDISESTDPKKLILPFCQVENIQSKKTNNIIPPTKFSNIEIPSSLE